MVYYLIFLVGYIGVALVQDITIADSLTNKFRELGHVSKHTDIKLAITSHCLRSKCEHFYKRTCRLINTIENALIAVWEIAAVNKCVKRA